MDIKLHIFCSECWKPMNGRINMNNSIIIEPCGCVELKKEESLKKEFEYMWDSIEKLHKNNPSIETYKILNNLINACMWSEETFSIVKNANEVLKDICKNGTWK